MLTKSILEINFNPIYFSYHSGLVLRFLISVSYITEDSDLLGCDTVSQGEGPTVRVSVFRLKVHTANEVTSVKMCCIPCLSLPFVFPHSLQT
jgi:hypothetical protein